MLLLLSRFSHVWLCATPQTAAHQSPRPWDSPGKNTGVGCHFLPQCMKVKSESEVAQLCPTLSNPMECSPPGASIHGIFQARVLEWGAIAFSDVYICMDIVVVQSTSRTATHQVSLFSTIFWRLFIFMLIDLVRLSNHLFLCHPLLLLPSVFPDIRVFFQWAGSSHQVAKVLEFQQQSF